MNEIKDNTNLITMEADHVIFSHICNTPKLNVILPIMMAETIPTICI
jgi:hypothetical protein